jgi:hypothetical protein
VSLQILAGLTAILRLPPEAHSPAAHSLRTVRDAIAGRNDSIPRVYAMGLLLASDFPNKHRDFEAVLENPAEPSEMRYAAAIHLGRMNEPEARRILLSASNIADEVVLAGVVKALGWTGGRETVEVVRSVAERSAGLAVLPARFAATLITHRLGLEPYVVLTSQTREYLELLPDGAGAFSATAADSDEAELCLRSLAAEPLAIEFAERPMYQIRCAQRSWMLLFNRDVIASPVQSGPLSRPCVPAVVASKIAETGRYSIAWLLLSAPAGTAGALSWTVFRTTGELIFGATARMRGDQVSFKMRAVRRPGAFAVQLDGRFSNGELALDTALASIRVLPKREPAPSPGR